MNNIHELDAPRVMKKRLEQLAGGKQSRGARSVQAKARRSAHSMRIMVSISTNMYNALLDRAETNRRTIADEVRIIINDELTKR